MVWRFQLTIPARIRARKGDAALRPLSFATKRSSEQLLISFELKQLTTICRRSKKRSKENGFKLGKIAPGLWVPPSTPEPLKQIAVDLLAQVPRQVGGDLSRINQTITAVDGSVIDTIVRVADLAWVPKKGGDFKHAYRLHTQFEVLRGVPNCIDVTSANPKGAADERAVLQQTLEPYRCYLTDRGYAKFVLWNQVNAIGSSYVCRIRDTRRDSHPQGHYQRFKMQYSSHVIFPLPQASWRNPLLLALKGSVFNLKEMITFQKHTVELNVLEGLRCFKLTTTRGVLQTCPASIQHSLRIPIAQ